MQRRIQPLSQQLANQIAAGEVVERPASVVKELLENSIDAGAGRIELEVEQGGSKRIRVLDDGYGIHGDDLLLAISPHATSKIYSQQELEQIGSLGFRGEALASIASVSRFTLCSHLQGEESGWQITNNGKGGLSTPVPCPLPAGTSVEVRDLFFNTPARRKFLRSERTEFLHVEEVIKRLALSRFDVAFYLMHNGRHSLRLRSARGEAEKRRRVADVLGKSFVQHAVNLDFEATGMRLWGWLASPDFSRSQADSQYFYLNGRMIRDKLVNHAVRQAHQSILEPGRHPAYLLYLDVDPRQVDINVHPTKHEVRFRESRLVHDFVFRALHNALTKDSQTRIHATPHSTGGAVETVNAVARYPRERKAGAAPQHKPQRVAEQMAFYRQSSILPAGNRRQLKHSEGPLGRALGLLHGRYLLAQNTDGPLLIDLDAARKFLLARRIQAMLSDGEVQNQPLLIPITINLDGKVIAGVESKFGELLRLGFILERLGAESLVLREVPVILRGADAELILRRLIELLQPADEPVDSETLVEVLAGDIVEFSKIDQLSDAERILRELETLEDFGKTFWKPLQAEQLKQWLGSTG